MSSANSTNVGRAAFAIASHDNRGIEQVVFYSDGLGTRPSLPRCTAALFGIGLDQSIKYAYRLLIFNYSARAF
ncbi:MAG: hypothetical protein EXR10_11740 [Alphaproteobacteria bacterium]|nr:hypothetical protein [Alphaproteobacteria bacterium]